MEVLHPRCCGLDVHKATVVACVRRVIDPHVCNDPGEPDSAGGVANRGQMHARRNGSDGCLLEACLAHIVRRRLRAGAGECAHIKNVPGRKSTSKMPTGSLTYWRTA